MARATQELKSTQQPAMAQYGDGGKLPPTGPAAERRELEPSEKIPALRNVAPGVFVPFHEDILSKTDYPRDRIDRVKRILESIDYQREGVKENLMYLFEREKQRILLEAQEKEQELGLQDAKPGVHPAEVDATLRSMEAPAEPGCDYNIRFLPPLEPHRSLATNLSLRDRTVQGLLSLVESGVADLNGYERHINGIRDYYVDCLAKEVARIEAAGMRPEERGRAQVAEAEM
ncbi:hypothetical protein B0H66DRAFT_334855 [Apodospora peruviana]|uniref:Uncharacterized protein n=1 Tax=Apodospora peruviana TaxID=516989 RepID=A0AAE0HYE0_9PEZI|nr:hypothetical protein B0H66DRAFT_334855 [Apodospora peruviana]